MTDRGMFYFLPSTEGPPGLLDGETKGGGGDVSLDT